MATGRLDAAGTDETPGIGEQDDLEEHGRIEGGGNPCIVTKARTQGGEIEFLIDQMAQGELEGARAEAVRLRRAAEEFREQTTAASSDLVRIAAAAYEYSRLKYAPISLAWSSLTS